MTRRRPSISDEQRERLYREAMAARRAGDPCPLCNLHHSALSTCDPAAVEQFEQWKRTGYRPPPAQAVPPLARTTDVETSHDAAAAGDKHALRFIVLAIYAEHPEGLVDDDLARLAGYHAGHESYRRRGSDLRALGWTEWLMERAPDASKWDAMSERPVRRETHLGSTARVAVITPLGRTVLENYRDAS